MVAYPFPNEMDNKTFHRFMAHHTYSQVFMLPSSERWDEEILGEDESL
jgi:hypothetical protein